MIRAHSMPFGAQVDSAGRTRFRLWAPSAREVAVKVLRPKSQAWQQRALRALGEGWFETILDDAGAGTRYCYRIDDEIDVPDPASRFNPQGVHAASEVVDPMRYDWRDEGWRGRRWHELVIYELHVGTFTQAGTYAALAERLDDLAALGITAIELMPLATFAGARGWGYDGVLPFAPHPAYGTPDELKSLVERAHERNLAVLLDVVYNHFGPEGNYLGRYAREFFTSRHCTPWGDAIDFSNPNVRQFFIRNACYWIEEYRLDGLRLDAVHAIHDDGPRHFVDELIDAVQDGPGRERAVHIILENHRNEARRLRRPNVSQWNDDFHHALHVPLTGETEGYYADYADRPIERLGRCLAHGFGYQGELSRCSGEHRGEPSGHLSPLAFVNFLQNHDQIGNRALGERLSELASPQSLRAGLAVLLLAPQLPMLFMGEEYAAEQSFFYFCDYTGDLAAAVRDGRRAEFASFAAFSDEARREQIPDPNAEETFRRSRLVWEERDSPPHRQWLEYVRDLLRIRARHIAPLVPEIDSTRSRFRVRGTLLEVGWRTRADRRLTLFANLSGASARAEHMPAEESLLFATHSDAVSASLRSDALAPWEVRVFLA